MRALTLEPEYLLVLAGLMRAKLASSSSDTMGGPEETKEEKLELLLEWTRKDKMFTLILQHKSRGVYTCLA